MEKSKFSDKLIKFMGETVQEFFERREDDHDAEMEQSYREGLKDGLSLAAKAMLIGKMPEDRVCTLLGKQWNLRPTEIEPVVARARNKIKEEAEWRKSER